MNDLQLYIPKPEDGWFYVKMMSDPATMAYNAPWFPPDGCIPNPEAEWIDLQANWIGQEPKRFYAYLQRSSDGAFVGDVNYHYNPERDWWDMGVLIYAPERGKGYGRQGLRLLIDRAFSDGVKRLHNDFETERDAAYHIHKSVGFREVGRENGIVQLELTREEIMTEHPILVEEIGAESIPQVAPLVAQFRVTLKAFKGIHESPDAEAGASELKEYLDAGFPVYAARSGDRYCGYLVCRVDAPCVWVESIYVLPECRRQGVGAALFQKAEALASSYGEDTVYNYVHPNNDRMIAFLKSRGYKVLNLIEIRKTYPGETPTTQIRVANHTFDY